jgi:MFS family permease
MPGPGKRITNNKDRKYPVGHKPPANNYLCTFDASKIQYSDMEQIRGTLRDSAKMRWAMMILVSLLMAANYYFYDALSPLKSILQQHLGFSSQDYGIVAGFYAFPNTFLLMAILGGIILDKMGIRPTGFLFAIFMLIGAFLTAYGASDYFSKGGLGHGLMGSFWPSYTPELKMMSLGMLIFGLGAETSIVVTSKILVKWFKGHEIALAFALNLGIARIGTALAFNISPRLVMPDNWNLPIWFAVMLLLIGFLTFLVYLMFDVKLDRQIKSAGPLLNKDEEFHLADLGKLFTNRSFLFITFLCVTFYAAVFPFLKYAPDFFFHKFGISREASGDVASLLPYGTVLFTPLFGWFVDKKGRSASLMIWGSLLLIIVHLLFSFTSINPYILMVVLGIAFSLVPAAMWPSVAKIVPEYRIGTAYGTMFSLQNLGLFAVPILAGTVLDATNPGITPRMIELGAKLNYTPTILMFVGFSCIGFLFALLLKWDDKSSGYGLELPSNQSVEVPEKKE